MGQSTSAEEEHQEKDFYKKGLTSCLHGKYAKGLPLLLRSFYEERSAESGIFSYHILNENGVVPDDMNTKNAIFDSLKSNGDFGRFSLLSSDPDFESIVDLYTLFALGFMARIPRIFNEWSLKESATYYFEKAFSESRKRSQSLIGDVGLQYAVAGLSKAELGLLYEKGLYGAEKDVKRAFGCYNDALADFGCVIAASHKAWCLEFGIGTEKNAERAFELYRYSAGKGYNPAKTIVAQRIFDGNFKPEEIELAMTLLKESADVGHITAQYQIAKMYETGDRFPQDYDEALKYYKLAAERGFAPAKNEGADLAERIKFEQENAQKETCCVQ
jgi:TPR repeat protein